MTDPFLDQLRADWQRQPTATDDLAARIDRRRRRLGYVRAAEAAAALLGLLAGGWCLWRAATDGSVLLGLAGGAVLMEVWFLLASLRGSSAAGPDAATGAGADQLRRLRAQLDQVAALARRWRRSAFILLAAAAGLWLFVPVQAIPLHQAALLSAVWAGVALSILLWVARRTRRLADERAACAALLAQYEQDAPSAG